MGDVRGQRGGARVNDRAHQLSPIQENSIWRSATGARRGATASRRTRRSTTASSPCPSRSTTTSPSAPSPRVARRTHVAPRPRPRTRGPSQAAEERDTKALRAPAATWEAAHARQVALDEAYVYYKRFGKLALDTIPSHNYYKDPRYKDDKKQLKANCVSSLAKLESLVGVMDGDEALLAAEGEKVRALEAKRRAAEARAAEIARLAAEKRAREDAAAAAAAERQRALRAEADARAAKAAAQQREDARILAEQRQLLERAAADKAARAAAPLAVGARVAYDRDGAERLGVVAAVHNEDPSGPYYTVRLDGPEPKDVQTERHRLRPAAAAPAAPAAPGGRQSASGWARAVLTPATAAEKSAA